VSRTLPRQLLFVISVLATVRALPAAGPPDAVLFLDFDDGETPQVTLSHGAERVTGKFGTALEFTDAMQYAQVSFSHRLNGAKAATVGGWFMPKRAGEQSLLFRGEVKDAPGARPAGW